MPGLSRREFRAGASKQADEDMKHMPQSMSDFFRAFYYMKGGEFPGNQNLTPPRPMPTAREAAAENARMPEYYVMRRDRGMPATMVAFMPSKEYIANCKWFTQAWQRELRRQQRPRCLIPVLPDDVPAHPLAVAMECAMLAPKSEVSIFSWKEPRERIPLAMRQIHSFLEAHRPA